MTTRLDVTIAATAAAQLAVVALAAVTDLTTGGWVRVAVAALAAGAVALLAAVALDVRRLHRANASVRGEIDALAAVPFADLMAGGDDDAVRNRLPAVSDDGLGLLVGQVEQLCAAVSRRDSENEDVRAGYTEVFVNMFRRSQTLLQRQLEVVERLESGDRSSTDMHLLFQLDHLVTRMRRNNENVLVLAGTELVRATKDPVPVEAVFRAAMSEVDRYQRIRVLGMPSVRISNTAAGDLIRIIAELLDNATAFSPPDKEVTVNAELGRHAGLSIGVFDNGIGMSDEDVRKANEQLRNLGSAQIARSRRVGLFVVGRLAGRHGLKVELFGGDEVEGVSALISVPSSLLLEEEAVRAGVPDPVAVRTTVRMRETKHAKDDGATVHRVSSWYGKSKAWRAERDNALSGARREAAERRGREHDDIPATLPMRVPGTRGAPPAPEAAPAVVAVAPAAPVDVKQDARAASRWFRARDEVAGARSDGDAPPPVTPEPPRQETVYTEDGLPLRRKGANLVPGIAVAVPDGPDRHKPIERDPAHLRRRLSSYQVGVRKAKEQEDRMRGRQHHTGGWTVLERETGK
ncbi:sensor histidine kinase [Saccharothrix texasensis]|uniref:histidine kinase n=1 Tax=Saccharothrix texasensis TaxID=103734 RepID=A0A3N1HHU5_9PSEU|nr:ATP-binding protein [Saccharothrix texasensis]ROP42034.1 signal transduction histidine kinase [Saccharothrix texasensis]